MKGILLTGGTGTRLKPYTDFVNKHLLTVAGKPMIEYPLKTLENAGCGSIGIIYNDRRIMYLDTLVPWDKTRFTYIWQEQPLGIAQAVYLARDFIGNDDFLVLCGDNYFKRPLKVKPAPQVWASEIPNRGLTVLGAYHFDKRFFEIFPLIEKSPRGEYEMASIMNGYGAVTITQVLPSEWADMGTIEGIKRVEDMLK